MTTDQILQGLGLVLVLAVCSQLAAARFGLPAIVVLLPVGFVAGAVTHVIHPADLLGGLYQPFVSVAVGVILFEAGLQLNLAEIDPRVRTAVLRLISVAVLVTGALITVTTYALFGAMSWGVAAVIGAVLVVSGPTVVLPLLGFIRPSGRVRSLLKFEGVLVDPVGAIIGVLVFQGVQQGIAGGTPWRPGELLVSLVIGLIVGIAGALVLMVLLGDAHRNAPRMVVPVTVMVVVAAVVAADLWHDDAGLAAATLMGAVLANQRRIAIARPLYEFNQTLVQFFIGILFILVSASVTPHDVEHVLARALVLVAVMVLVIRPLAVAISTHNTGFTVKERAFVAWMAPRGIVAGATASSFGPALVSAGAPGANDLLPVVFVCIFTTVVLYGLTAGPLARRLGVAGAGGALVLVVGGNRAAREFAAALEAAGARVQMWAGAPSERDAALAAGIEADQGAIMLDAASREAALEDVTDVVLLSPSDDFNTLAAADLRAELGHGHVYRIAPDPQSADLIPPEGESLVLGSAELTFARLAGRLESGECIAAGEGDVLCVVSAGGRLAPAARRRQGDRPIALAAAGARSFAG